MEILQNLNPEQKEGVKITEGPLLLIAGAGSGKTRVLTHRIAYIIEKQKAKPWEILAITFTNKAAKEMKERVADLVYGSEDMWISTFHAACVRILRREAKHLGYNNNFNIYDTSDKMKIIKDCAKELDIDTKKFTPRSIASAISKAKNQLITAKDYVGHNFHEKQVEKVYKMYDRRVKANNAMDFDDLIFETVRLFRQHPDILERYQNQFKYIMVDEYQDTNHSQYILVNFLAKGHRNICVVGDDDQSIYLFRGADVANILDFEKDYPDAKVIKLERNYRSTQCILNAANEVIKNNEGRKGKNLWTENCEGEKPVFYHATDHIDEIQFMADEINKEQAKGRKLSDCTILIRANALTRSIEEVLLKRGIPYQIFAGTEFFNRKEIKDVMAYLSVISNPSDDLSLTRIINVPKRGIGNKTVERLMAVADQKNKTLYDVLKEDAEQIVSRGKDKIKQLVMLIENLREMSQYLNVTDLLDETVNRSGYRTMLQSDKTEESKIRLENIEELFTVTKEFDNTHGGSLDEFLQQNSLASDADESQIEDSVKIMTLHSAKGLEFPVVFMAGFEEKLFPHIRSMEDPQELQEERRLCYVGITRAKEKLYITAAQSRALYGRVERHKISRFLEEIPQNLIEDKSTNKYSMDNLYSRKGPQKANLGGFSMPQKQNTNITYRVGMLVEHKKFGQGIITEIKALGDDQGVTINFEKAGSKTLMASFAPLEVLEG
ncbi:DNA helicase PcrA [Proteinivorax hydrogeniformans]|uniref:ATP-dependent DNA helicase n=1 Tax=Proteinivorax hydrogeniformans TaxID=1826727 RepID=A0AAU8HRL4_9FIRM